MCRDGLDDLRARIQAVYNICIDNSRTNLSQTNRCGHCTRFAPTYANIAKDLHHRQRSNKKHPRKVNVAKVDGDKERALASRFSVGSFPSFFLVDGWTVREFSGSRSHDGLVKFALEDYEKTEPVPFLFGPFG